MVAVSGAGAVHLCPRARLGTLGPRPVDRRCESRSPLGGRRMPKITCSHRRRSFSRAASSALSRGPNRRDRRTKPTARRVAVALPDLAQLDSFSVAARSQPRPARDMALVGLIRQMLPSAAMTLHLRPVRAFSVRGRALQRRADWGTTAGRVKKGAHPSLNLASFTIATRAARTSSGVLTGVPNARRTGRGPRRGHRRHLEAVPVDSGHAGGGDLGGF